MAKFHKDFLLGTATAAHQVEGNNVNSDCWAQEHMKNTTYVEPSLDAVDHYNRYEEDIRLMAQAGLNAYRFSIEWARIQPAEKEFDQRELNHYKDVIACCKKYGIEPVITLMHFSSPKWLISKGGWEADTTPQDFANYVEYVISAIGKDIKYVCTINEANMGIQVAAIAERYTRQLMAMAKAKKIDDTVQMGINIEKMMAGQKAIAQENLVVFGVDKAENFTAPRTPHGDEIITIAHVKAREIIRRLAPHIKVGLSLSLHDVQAIEGGEKEAQKIWAEEFTHYLPTIADDDYLGVQCYTRSLIGADGIQPNPQGATLTQMGYEFYPQALGNVIRTVAKDWKKEILVTENGIATADDELRKEYIRIATDEVNICIADGLPVKGYFYWSLLDNFEWQKGFSMTFGLISVDRSTQTRIPKKSLAFLGSLRK